MKNDCKSELIEGLKEINKMSISLGDDEKSLLQQEIKLDRLFYLFKLEMERNINVTNNFPMAYKYVREVQHEFFCLLKYSLKKSSVSIFLKRRLINLKMDVSHNRKYTDQEYEKIRMRFSVCKQTIDFIVFKSCLLKELKEEYFSIPVISGNLLRWNGSQTDLIEVVQFLYETKIISKENGTLTLKEAILTFSRLFNMKISGIYSKIGKQRQRRQGKSTKVYQIWTTYQQKKD